MKVTINRTLTPSQLTHGAQLARRSRTAPLHPFGLLVGLLAATLGLGLTARTPARAADMARDLRVGHTVETMVVPGSTLCKDPPVEPCAENRDVDVHLWYPADITGSADAPKTVYRSALYGRALFPEPDPRWQPLSWQVESELAREAPIDPHGPAYPVIVFSHGSTNDPIDYAPTLERIAGAGFVVAAPAHVNNTQDDERIDYINGPQQGGKLHPPVHFFDCRDGRPSPCSRTNIPRSMEDRARDIRHTLDNLPDWLGDRVDVSRVGVMGHSRGTVTALAAAGGSTTWGFPAVPRVDAVMGLAIGAQTITSGVNLANVTAPTLLVAGQKDTNPPPPNPGLQVSKFAFDTIHSTEKAFVIIPNAVHRSFDSAYCDELKSAAAITHAAGTSPNGEQNAPLDWHTARLIGTSYPGGLSGMAHEYCSADTFSNPDLTEFMASSFNGVKLNNGTIFAFPPDPDAIPTTGLETDEVKQGVAELAVTFFGTVLKRVGNDGPHFTRFLAPKWLEKQVPMVGNAEAFAGADAICPPGVDVDCGD